MVGAMNSANIRVGRLLEIIVDDGYRTVDDVNGMIAAIGAAVGSLPPSTNVVIVADWRGCRLMSPAAAERAHLMFTTHNPRIERSAVLTSATSPTAVLQFMRLASESQHPARRVFTDTGELATFLAPLLDDAERERLGEVLARTPAA